MASSYFMLKILRRKQNARRLIEAEREMKAGNINNKCEVDTKKCRICLKLGVIPIYDKHCNDTAEAVKIFGDINISEEDEYPKHLCEICHSLLQAAILFRKLAKESDNTLHLRQIEQNKTDFIINAYTNIIDNENDVNSEDNNSGSIEPQKLYNCKLCNLNFFKPDEYIKHNNSKQHKNIRIQCAICKRLLTLQLYKRHLARHQSATHLICDVCGKLYRKDNLVRHLQLHSFDLPFQCQLCPYRGRFMESLRIHMRTHTGDKPFACDKCHLRFLTRSNLSRHLLTHKKERPYKCLECGRGFYTKCDLDVHFKSDHAGIKDYVCRLCGSKYGTRKALMRHELRVHKRNKMAKGRMPLYMQAEYQKQ